MSDGHSPVTKMRSPSGSVGHLAQPPALAGLLRRVLKGSEGPAERRTRRELC
jgi:hypothetical protein